MQIKELHDPNPFNVDIYRTDEVLFLHVQPAVRHTFLKQVRLLATFFVFPFGFVFFVTLFSGRLQDVFVVCAVFGVTVGLLAFSLYMMSGEQVLIEIDKDTIRRTSWYFGNGTSQTCPRPERIGFFKHEAQWHFTGKSDADEDGTGVFGSFRARNHEIRWIAETIERFEQEVPRREPPPEVEQSAMEIEPARKILETLEYRGRRLRWLPNPSEQKPRQKEDDRVLPGTLQVLCARCNTALPSQHVLADAAAAHCPTCGFLFEIADMKRYEAPRRSRIELFEDDDVLKVHQKPGIPAVPLLLLAVLFSMDIVFVAAYLQILMLDPAATLAEIDPAGRFTGIARMVVAVHAICFLMLAWFLFVHRDIEFRRNEACFRIRWLCFRRSWTVPRSEVGPPTGSFWALFWHGFYIPYGNKDFYLGAGRLETPWLAGEINHWLFTHPPEEFHLDERTLHSERMPFDEIDRHPTVGGVVENDKEIRWHCPASGHVFDGGEMDFPNRKAACPDCGTSHDFSELRRFAVEPMTVEPVFPEFSTEESETESVMTFARLPLTRKDRIGDAVTFSLATLFLIGGPIFVAILYVSKTVTANANPGLMAVAMLLFLPVLAFLCSPYLLIFLLLYFNLCDERRQRFTKWSTRFSSGFFELTRSYKNREEILRFETERIVEFRRGGPARKVTETMQVWPLWGRFPSNLESRGRSRNELVLDDGSVIYLPVFPEAPKKQGPNAWLVNAWNETVVESRFLTTENTEMHGK